MIFISSTARGLYCRILQVSARAGWETEVSAGVARGERKAKIQRIVPARIGNGQFRVPGAERVLPMKKGENRLSPARGAGRTRFAERFWGECCVPPESCALWGRFVSPLRETRRPPLGAPPEAACRPPRFARLRGRGLPQFCRLHGVNPLRPAQRTSCGKH